MNKAQTIPSDYGLLRTMVGDSKMVPAIYRPGSYWQAKTEIATREIEQFGLEDFRGSTNSIGTSYADNALIDIRGHYNYGLRLPLSFLLRKVFPFSRIFDSQVNLTKCHFQNAVGFKNIIANDSARVKELLDKFRVPSDSTRGGCLDYCEIKGEKISNHYLELLHTHDVLSKHIDFQSARSFFEIGGGFGVNVHILIENYNNIRKFIYLDIPPNLYVGTQYLKSFYGESVIAYSETRKLEKIEFNYGNELEIICIAPHQVENLNVEIDIFQNSHSFVEMSDVIVQNYAKHIIRMTSLNNSSIALVSYDGFNLDNTHHPDNLPDFFSREFCRYEEQTLWRPERKNYYYVAKRSTPK